MVENTGPEPEGLGSSSALHSLATWSLCLHLIICKMGLTAPPVQTLHISDGVSTFEAKLAPQQPPHRTSCFCCSSGTALWGSQCSNRGPHHTPLQLSGWGGAHTPAALRGGGGGGRGWGRAQRQGHIHAGAGSTLMNGVEQ